MVGQGRGCQAGSAGPGEALRRAEKHAELLR
jgi:hypothetical protein